MDVIEDPRLICGFHTHPTGEVERLGWQAVDAALDAPDGFVWLHLDASDVRVQRWLSAQESVPPEARAILLGSDEHATLRTAGPSGLTGVVHDLRHDFQDDPTAIGALRIYFDERRVITTRRQPLQAIDRLRRSMEDDCRHHRPLPLVAGLLLHLSDAFVGLVQEATQDLDEVEAAILGDSGDGAADLGRVRRLLARLRRHLGPQHLALGGLAARPPAWASAEDAAALRDALARLDAVGHDLELAQERGRQLQDERGARLAETTNRNLYVLSTVTAIFLPITLVTGVFGMNVGGLPGVQDPGGFWWVIGAMMATAAATWAVLKWLRIL